MTFPSVNGDNWVTWGKTHAWHTLHVADWQVIANSVIHVVAPHCWKSYSVSLVALIVIRISHLILHPPSSPLFPSHFGCNLLSLLWKKIENTREVASSLNGSFYKPIFSSSPLSLRWSLLLSKASSVFLCSGSLPFLLYQGLCSGVIPSLYISSIPPLLQVIAISMETQFCILRI